MTFTITVNTTENSGPIDEATKRKFETIFSKLIQSGGLTGVRNGQTILHFDGTGKFRGVQLSYWPWQERS